MSIVHCTFMILPCFMVRQNTADCLLRLLAFELTSELIHGLPIQRQISCKTRLKLYVNTSTKCAARHIYPQWLPFPQTVQIFCTFSSQPMLTFGECSFYECCPNSVEFFRWFTAPFMFWKHWFSSVDHFLWFSGSLSICHEYASGKKTLSSR